MRKVNADTYNLGFWESGQIMTGLSKILDEMKEGVCQGCQNDDGCYGEECDADNRNAVWDLYRMFSGGPVSVTVKREED